MNPSESEAHTAAFWVRESLRGGAGIALAGLVLLAAALRFTGLDWGLRHPVHIDELVYVENVVAMVEAGDLDHRFYTYPGLFFYLLAPGVALLGPERWHGPDAYLISRALVAAVGVFNVALVFFVGSRLANRATGLIAALFMAVSPIDVQVCHQVRPDILLESCGLAALLVFRRVGSTLRGDVHAGLLIGIATAVKFSGLLLVPFYLAARLLAPGRRFLGMVVAGAITIGVTLAATPYAIIHAESYRRGPGAQLKMYYQSSEPRDFAYIAENAAFYAAQFERTFGPATWVLLGIGAFLVLRRDWRAWGPRLLHPVVTVAVMSTAHLVFKRLILPSMGVVALIAAMPLAWVAQRSRLLAIVGALAVALGPLRGSIGYANVAAHPSTMDGVLDWVEANVPEGARILDTRLVANPGMAAGMVLGVDPRRYELIRFPVTGDARSLDLLVRDADLVLTPTGAHWPWEEGLEIVHRGIHVRRPLAWWGLGEPQRGVALLRVQAPRLRPRYRAMDLSRAQLSASDDPAALARLFDGDGGSAWRTAESMTGEEWIEVRFERAARVGRIEIVLGYTPERHGPDVTLLTLREGESFAPVWAARGHPAMLDQLRARKAGSPRPLSQRLLIEPEPVVAFRLLQTGHRSHAWVLAELRVDVYEGNEESGALVGDIRIGQ